MTTLQRFVKKLLLVGPDPSAGVDLAMSCQEMRPQGLMGLVVEQPRILQSVSTRGKSTSLRGNQR
jgi:hypothetical protein